MQAKNSKKREIIYKKRFINHLRMRYQTWRSKFRPGETREYAGSRCRRNLVLLDPIKYPGQRQRGLWIPEYRRESFSDFFCLWGKRGKETKIRDTFRTVDGSELVPEWEVRTGLPRDFLFFRSGRIARNVPLHQAIWLVTVCRKYPPFFLIE